ncbi:ABC transporter ATP-binding protein [Salisediminibacterium beveridgei]|uniref:Carnitine transport ATP-binding protein OpuCA n=1 Tax=Salisediminibacterium beveridgei TaxID=632773 RepID=A0A1D7QVN9_9BACI|nr:ABC transporter ATP-binding protein [Salisediminibacterium beveridgei]AOM83028.1 Glycine betaine/carnitine/choline transport ATP-binding protein OpuCA [Salisediminibacterium beveridgei]
MIEFKGISKSFPDGTKAVNDLSIFIEKGEFFVMIGPSGSGKTTALKMINRLIDPTEGSIYLDGVSIHDMSLKELRGRIGYVLQQIALFPHMTIEENIRIVPDLKKWPEEKIGKRVDELMQMVGLDPSIYKKRMPKELSGGQQQRVGVIRALAGDPDILLMDEPFSALDPISREQLQKDIQQLQREIQKTIVFVTHDMDEALALGERVALMNDGATVQVDTPEQLIHRPVNKFVQDFLGDRRDPWLMPLKDLTRYFSEVDDDDALEASAELSVGMAFEKMQQDSVSLFIENNGRKFVMTPQMILKYLYDMHKVGSKGGDRP